MPVSRCIPVDVNTNSNHHMRNCCSQSLRNALKLAGLVLLLNGSGALTAQDLVDPPEDQDAAAGEDVTFSVEPRHAGLAYQWLRQWPDRIEVLKGQSDSRLTLTNAAISDVGLYVCAVALGDQVQLTRAASLTLWTRSAAPISKLLSATTKTLSTLDADTLTVYAAPVTSSGSIGTCPGSYVGYVSYRKTTADGWGWAPSTNTTVHAASDTVRTDTKITFTGNLFDSGCQQTSVLVPDPPTSSKYRFTIYFPTSIPATNAYPITLTGFEP